MRERNLVVSKLSLCAHPDHPPHVLALDEVEHGLAVVVGRVPRPALEQEQQQHRLHLLHLRSVVLSVTAHIVW